MSGHPWPASCGPDARAAIPGPLMLRQAEAKPRFALPAGPRPAGPTLARPSLARLRSAGTWKPPAEAGGPAVPSAPRERQLQPLPLITEASWDEPAWSARKPVRDLLVRPNETVVRVAGRGWTAEGYGETWRGARRAGAKLDIGGRVFGRLLSVRWPQLGPGRGWPRERRRLAAEGVPPAGCRHWAGRSSHGIQQTCSGAHAAAGSCGYQQAV